MINSSRAVMVNTDNYSLFICVLSSFTWMTTYLMRIMRHTKSRTTCPARTWRILFGLIPTPVPCHTPNRHLQAPLREQAPTLIKMLAPATASYGPSVTASTSATARLGRSVNATASAIASGTARPGLRVNATSSASATAMVSASFHLKFSNNANARTRLRVLQRKPQQNLLIPYTQLDLEVMLDDLELFGEMQL